MRQATSVLSTSASAAQPLDAQTVRRLRKQLADRIERDIALLDLLDGDPDLEPDNDDEPSLGSANPSQLGWSGGGLQDLEGEWA
jgi:hypothetical protein